MMSRRTERKDDIIHEVMRYSVKNKPRKETFSDLCLETEDGDEETDCCCDAQTQHHRLGVVETV